MTPQQLKKAKEAALWHSTESHDATDAALSASGDRGWWNNKARLHADFSESIDALIEDVTGGFND